jgi:hypothetical protein
MTHSSHFGNHRNGNFGWRLAAYMQAGRAVQTRDLLRSEVE